MPKLSIITVNLNNKAGLEETAKSVVAQTWDDYEWIIIDGGSTDGSVEVIKKYAAETEKLVYWCSEPDGGIYQGMNKGILRAKGKYCWFLNSGDCAFTYTTLADIFKIEHDEDIIYGNMKIRYLEGLKHEDLLRSMKKSNPCSLISWARYPAILHQASFIKHDLLVNLHLYNSKDYKIAGDTDFFIRAIFQHSAKCKYVDTVFALFKNGGISTVDKMQKFMRLEHVRTIIDNFPESYEKIYALAYLREMFFEGISILFLPFIRLKCLFARIEKFGIGKSVNYYKQKYF